jgi:hypothetical protein
VREPAPAEGGFDWVRLGRTKLGLVRLGRVTSRQIAVGGAALAGP